MNPSYSPAGMGAEPSVTEPTDDRESTEVATTAAARVALAASLFAFLEDRGVPYVVVGDVRDYDRTIASDIDLVVAEDALPGMPQLLAEFAAKNDGQLVQVLRHERGAFYFVLAHRVDGRVVFIQPDVCASYVRRGRRLMSAEELLDGRRSAPFGGCVPSPASAFGYYFVKKTDKGLLDAQAFAYLRDLWELDRDGCIDRLGQFLPNDGVPSLIGAMDQADFDAVTTKIGGLRRTLERAHPVTWSDRRVELLRAVARWSRPTGIWVAFYGPDGAGKSSVIERVEARLAPAFRRTAKYHLRPHIGRLSSTSGTSVTAPHGEPARSVPASLAKAAYWFLDATAGYWFRIRLQLVRSTLVVFDRYVDDLVVDPKRYRFGAPAWVAAALRRATPRPDVTIVLDAPAEVLQARKAEVTLEEAERQRRAYRSLADRSTSAVVDATRPLPDVVKAVEGVILDRLGDRTARRLELL